MSKESQPLPKRRWQSCSRPSSFKRVVDECLPFHGGFGYVEEYPIARAYRDARVSTIVAGTSEIMREIVAKALIDKMDFGKTEEKERSAEGGAKTADAPAAMTALTQVPTTLPELMRSLPARHRKDKTEGWKARVHFKIKGSATPEWTVNIDSITCSVKEGLEGTPDCVVSTTEDVYLAVEQGKQNPQMAVLTGKLKISNVAVMMRYTKSFSKIRT